MEKTMSIYEVISKGLTVKNNRAARVNAKAVGIDNYANWKVAVDHAFEAFYRYADARRKISMDGEDARVDADLTSAAFKALRNVLALIGEVNGHKLIANDAMLNTLAGITMVNRKDLIGEAFTQASVVANLKDQVKDFRAGMNPEYVEKVNHDLEVAKIRLAELCKLENSAETKTIRVKAGAFYIALETELALIVNKQDAMSWEDLDARDAKIKEERDAKRRANKNAKTSAK